MTDRARGLRGEEREMRFRKRPIEIEAVRVEKPWKAVLEFCPVAQTITSGGGCRVAFFVIPTLEGNRRADIGDWIIKGVKGEFYPCKPDIFALTYEPVEERSEK